jgi:hypothetical protein
MDENQRRYGSILRAYDICWERDEVMFDCYMIYPLVHLGYETSSIE